MKYLLPLVLLTAVAAAGCNTQTADNSTTTTAPTTTTITEPAFTGTLSASQNGGQNNVYTFSVIQVGPLTVTLNAAGPPSGVIVGLAIGTPTFSTTGTTCTPIATANAQVGVNAPQISGTVSAAGPYCLAVYGLPPITADITYSVTVAHT